MENVDENNVNHALDGNGPDHGREDQGLGDRELARNDREPGANNDDPENHPYGDNDRDDNGSQSSYPHGRSGLCHICCESVPEDNRIWLDCNHLWCKPCLLRVFSGALKSDYPYPPKCCNDTIGFIPIDFEESEKVFDNEFVEQYKAKEEEYNTPGRRRVYCGNPSCSVFLGWASKEEYTESVAVCGDCRSTTCTGCKTLLAKGPEPFNGHHACENPAAVRENLGYNEENRIKRCPDCRTLVQLTDACNHIICTVCSWSFCFVCLSEYPCENNCPQYGDPEYDAEGFDERGYHRDTGFNREGYDRQGYNVRGINREGQRRRYHDVPGQTQGRGGGRGRGGGHAGRGGRGGGRGGAFVEADGYDEDYHHENDSDEDDDRDNHHIEDNLPALDQEELEEDRIMQEVLVMQAAGVTDNAEEQAENVDGEHAVNGGQDDGQDGELPDHAPAPHDETMPDDEADQADSTLDDDEPAIAEERERTQIFERILDLENRFLNLENRWSNLENRFVSLANGIWALGNSQRQAAVATAERVVTSSDTQGESDDRAE